jgi:uncharacterized membrane protein YraQ (UPF0718 family)
VESGPWFNFSFPDFSYAFLSILLEGVPFLLLGTLLSGVIDQFLPARLMTRWLPRNAYLGVCLSGLLGVIFPMCECGIVPVIRRLMGKGLPVSNAVAYMLAAPIVNPIVAVSTYVAFRGQYPLEMTALRLGIGYFIAVLVGLAVHNLSLRWVLKPSVMAEVAHPRALSDGAGSGSLGARWAMALEVSVRDFLDVAAYFVLGAAAAGLLGTAVNQQLILPLALNDWVATASMMGLAAVLSLCSTSDAFIAATFVAFPLVAKLAFLVFGPMVDLKLIFIYSAVFRKRFVFGLVVGLFILIALICVRMRVLWVDDIPVAL